MSACPMAFALFDDRNPAARIALCAAGAVLVFIFFKSIIRVGMLNQRYQDPLAFWVGRVVLSMFRFRVRHLPGGRARRGEIMTWYWPCSLIAVITSWFLLVTVGFALMNLAFRAEVTFTEAFVSSGSALSTLGFSTPTNLSGQLLAIFEGAIGLFLIVYLFTFLPGFMELIHERGRRVSWIYARTGPSPSGAEILLWHCRNRRTSDLDAVWEDWENFFRNLGQARSFLPILAVVRPLGPNQSWVCAFGAFLDALALTNSTVAHPGEGARICFDCGVVAVRNIHTTMRGTPIRPDRDPEQMHVERVHYDAACAKLEAAGMELHPDRELAWKRFIQSHMLYEEEIAWLAAALADPTPFWPHA